MRFQGLRLREAREARALTAVALSELVGVNAAAISHYENGRHVPGSSVFSKLAESLNVPPRMFYMPPRAPRAEVVFWRSRKSATDTQRARPLRRLQWLMDVVDFLSQFIEFPLVSIPGFAGPDDPSELRFEDLEECAANVREEWGLGSGPIGNLVALLEKHGAIVARSEVYAEALDAFSIWRKEDHRPYMTLGSDKQSAARSLIDAAHELGHMLVHRNVQIRDFNKSSLHSLMEKQAMRFAGAFLLPAEAFTNDLYSISLDAFRDLKSKWRVSVAAMISRATDLELINDDQARRLWINLTRRGWRKREPGDDETQPEAPQLLKSAFTMLMDNGVIDPIRLEIELGLRVRDIEAVVGLPDGYLQNQETAPLKFRAPS